METGAVDAEPGSSIPGLVEPATSHGGSPPRGLAHLSRSSVDRGRYGRMFRQLEAFTPDDASLIALANSMGPFPPPGVAADSAAGIQPGENPDIAAGYTYLGQFVTHDITFDPTSVLQKRNDPDALVDFKTPRFDLGSL